MFYDIVPQSKKTLMEGLITHEVASGFSPSDLQSQGAHYLYIVCVHTRMSRVQVCARGWVCALSPIAFELYLLLLLRALRPAVVASVQRVARRGGRERAGGGVSGGGS